MYKDIFVVLRRPYTPDSDDIPRWESVDYFDSQQSAIDSLKEETGGAVKPHYNVGDLFVVISIDYISDIENVCAPVFIVSKDRKIIFTVHCFEMNSESWFSGWEGKDADPSKMVEIAIKKAVPIKDIVGLLAECILHAIPMVNLKHTEAEKFLANELLSFSRGYKIDSYQWYHNMGVADSKFYVVLSEIYRYRNEERSPGGYVHGLVNCARYVSQLFPDLVYGRQIMVSVINKRIPLSRLLLLSRQYDE